MQNPRSFLKLYLVAGTQDCNHLPGTPEQNLLSVLEQALAAGITCFQLREKGKNAIQDTARIEQLAVQCRDLCRRYNVPFFIDDNIEIALALGADGVHIGQKDMPVEEAAALCRGKLMLGLSNNTWAEIEKNRNNPDLTYFAIGPIFSTQSKEQPNPTVGIDTVRAIREKGFDRPLVAIGGIKADAANTIRAAGADGIAVITAITHAPNIGEAVRSLLPQS